jgi:DNA-binding NarL/FixJ family response regulator
MSITVAIVEDDAGIRDALIRILGRSRDFRCLGWYATGEDALRELPGTKPDVILMDINLPGMSGVECVRRLKAQEPFLHIVMLTVYEDAERIFESLTAGATGYLLKRTPPAELLEAIRDVHSGGAPMSSQIARKVVQSFHAAPPASETAELSPREQEILGWLAQGFLIKEVADRLGIGFDTVRTHIRRIYEKLQVHSRAQAVAKVLRPANPPKAASTPDKRS